MDIFNAVGNWIIEHEIILSGSVALCALIGLVWAFLSRLKQQMTDSRNNARDITANSKNQPINLTQLSSPAPYPIHYTGCDGLRIAYAKFGKGQHNILMAPGIISHLNIQSHLPSMRDTAAAIGKFSNILTFDKRGQGLSDLCLHVPNLDERVHDIKAVMDAGGQDKTILLGVSEGGPMCIKFALEYPERVKGLILLGTAASFLQRPDFPGGLEEAMLDAVATDWGTGSLRHILFPSISKEMMDDNTYRAFERLVATRDSIKQIIEYMKDVDVRDMLPKIECPTLVLHFSGDMAIPVRLGRAMADAIPNSVFLELPGVDHADLSSAPEGVERVRIFAASLV
jgi:pimeloyl-ACP methyl ester carboxylesterase